MNPDSVLVPVQQSEEVSVCEVAGLFLSRKLNVHLQKLIKNIISSENKTTWKLHNKG